MNKAADAAR